MTELPPTGSFFSSSHAIITGGTFTSVNHITQHLGAVKGGYERLLDAVAPNALHNSGHVFDVPKCHPGTRVAVLQAIMQWMNGSREETKDKGINWVTGAAGSGKSAIGRTICERCTDEGTLLGDFFFSSSDPTRNHSKSLVATIAYQICSINAAIRKAVCDFIDYDPLIFNRSMRAQFSSLIMDPLATIYTDKTHHKPCLIVIDGLDECVDKASQRDLLETLLYVATTSLVPLRILVCSRPESHITSFFNLPRTGSLVFEIFLGDAYSPDADIRLYLSDRFTEIRQSHNLRTLLPDPWPSQDDVDQLVYKSSGQFVFAATVIRYVESDRHHPNQRLEEALGLRPSFKDLPFAELDALYTHILMLTEKASLAVDILAFPVLYGRLPVRDIESYLDLNSGDVYLVLSDLGAIANISKYGTPEVSMLHKSFSDFLFDSHRSKSLYRNRTETRACHIIRVIENFSKHPPSKICPSSHASILIVTVDNEIRYTEWDQQMKSRLLDAVTNFPMRSFCTDLFSHLCTRGGVDLFLCYFIGLLSNLNQYTEFKDIFSQHIRVFCECALSELHNQHGDDWEMNCMFSVKYIHPSNQFMAWRIGSIFGEIIARLSLAVSFEVIHALQGLLSNEEKSQILSKAATHCLSFLCNSTGKKREAVKYLQSGIHRKETPWLWRMRTLTPVFKRKAFLRGTLPWAGRPRSIIRTYGRLAPDSINKYFMTIANETQSCHLYISFLEYLPQILPLAGHYDPLIAICKTKSFAPKSMVFPALSRRARRAMARYLQRMQ